MHAEPVSTAGAYERVSAVYLYQCCQALSVVAVPRAVGWRTGICVKWLAAGLNMVVHCWQCCHMNMHQHLGHCLS